MQTDCYEYSNETVVSIMKSIEALNHLNDLDTILDRILYEARKLSSADAGSIFLKEEDGLRFSYVHNDTLFRENEANAELYTDFKVPITEDSIVGHCARTGEILALDDVYAISGSAPYSFNPTYDKKSGYRTTSMLTIPLKTFQNRLVGVMQLINSKNEKKENVPFSRESRLYVPLLANNASVVIERGIMNRELVLRMMKMAELRDPKETGAHVQRVGAYSAEIYQQWAGKKGVDKNEMRHIRDRIRLAAMLHDVGKVGISDTIIKKPGKLTDEEYDIMKWHTVYGARLFANSTSRLDIMSREIAMNHHEKWGGGGYPGKIADIHTPHIHPGEPKKGEEIPLAARITTLADVFDALASRRSYKDPWPDERILEVITDASGDQFDPDVVESFMDIFDVIKAIREKYREEQPHAL